LILSGYENFEFVSGSPLGVRTIAIAIGICHWILIGQNTPVPLNIFIFDNNIRQGESERVIIISISWGIGLHIIYSPKNYCYGNY